MNTWIRLWRNVDIKDIADSLLIVGLSSAECFSCHHIGLSKNSSKCSNCGKEFKYIGFRNRVNQRTLDNISLNRNLIFVDLDDFLREFNRIKARKFLGPDNPKKE